jgi:outer membrane immunogenic protein
MKKLLAGSVAIIALTAGLPAIAADLPVKAPAYKAAAAPAAYNWGGCYLGAHVGYGWGNIDSIDSDADTLKPSGVFGGGQIGCNWQALPNWVLGLEADFSAAHLHDRVFGYKDTDLSYFGTVRGRAGFTQANWLFYGTGGYAYGRNKMSVCSTPSCEVSKSHTGWAAGGGVEWAFAPNWSAKIEYLHIDLGKENYFCSCIYEALTADTVKLGINWRFSGGPSFGK